MFEYTDPDGDRLIVTTTPRFGSPALSIRAARPNVPEAGAAVHIPLARVEEVVAGIRDTARHAWSAVPFTAAELAAARADVADLEADPAGLPRRFHLLRHRDVSGISGTGVIADGVLWPDKTVSIRWRGERPSIVHWDHISHAAAVHGHGGATEFVWLDCAGSQP